MELIIHAGIHRTGTTSLQEFLSCNRSALLAKGIQYPGNANNHQQLAWSIKRGESGASDVISLLNQNCKKTILSAEDFSIHTDLSWIREVSKIVPTTILFYLRRQDHWIMSWYNQHVKWPFDKALSRMNPNDFLEASGNFYWIDYAALIQRWEEAIGPNHVQVAVVEKGQTEDVTFDFLDRLGVDKSEFSFNPRRVNDSLPVHILEIARNLDLYGMKPNQRIRLLGALRRRFPTPIGLPTTVYSPEQRLKLLSKFNASNRWVALRYFKRENLWLERMPDENDAYYRFPEIGRDQFLREWIAPLVHELIPKK